MTIVPKKPNRVSYSRGNLPIDFRPNLFQHATTPQLQSFGDPEVTRSPEVTREPKVPGGAYSSKNSVLHMVDYFIS